MSWCLCRGLSGIDIVEGKDFMSHIMTRSVVVVGDDSVTVTGECVVTEQRHMEWSEPGTREEMLEIG